MPRRDPTGASLIRRLKQPPKHAEASRMDAPGGEPKFDPGVAGASARREHERRRTNREKRVREKRPRLGGVILALGDAPQHETAWARGATGEELIAESLAKHVQPGVILLHDRKIPGSRANIDHIAVAPSGVWVIDSKRYKGKVAIAKPLLGKATLKIGGRNKTKLAEGLAKQVALVEEATRALASTAAVHGALCFADADLPMLGTLRFNGYPLAYPKRLAVKFLNADGPLTPSAVQALAGALAQLFPSA